MTRRIWIGGPLSGTRRWSLAVEDAGWEAYERAHIGVEQVDVDLVAELDGLPDWLCVTSSSAIPALASALDRAPELRTVAAAVVGDATAQRAAAVGANVQLTVTEGARRLAERLIAAADGGQRRVLWPRGDYSDDLAGHLTDAGWQVAAPHVYRTQLLELEGEHPRCDAVFFASPSGVRAFGASRALHRCGQPRIGVAIGRKTGDSLAEACNVADPDLDFPHCLTLDAPRPEELTGLLRGLDHDQDVTSSADSNKDEADA